jgi:hypothetical protein
LKSSRSGIAPHCHRCRAGVVGLALKSESEGSDTDDGADDADSLASAFEARPLFDVAFQIGDMPVWFEAQYTTGSKSGLCDRLDEGCAAFVLR